jgi:hypothetical protein
MARHRSRSWIRRALSVQPVASCWATPSVKGSHQPSIVERSTATERSVSSIASSPAFGRVLRVDPCVLRRAETRLRHRVRVRRSKRRSAVVGRRRDRHGADTAITRVSEVQRAGPERYATGVVDFAFMPGPRSPLNPALPDPTTTRKVSQFENLIASVVCDVHAAVRPDRERSRPLRLGSGWLRRMRDDVVRDCAS